MPSLFLILIRCVACLGIGGLALAAEMMALSPADRAWVDAHPVVRIQMSDSSPPFEFREGGRWQGLAYDCLQAACQRIGLRVEVTGMPWEQALAAIPEGKGVDLLLAVTRSPERERQMLLTRGYLAFPQVIIADRNHSFISGLQDLRQARVAVEREYVMEGWLRRDLPDARLLSTDGSPPALIAVSQGRAEAYVGNLAVASFLIERLGLVNIGVVAPSGYDDEDFAMGVRRDWPELVALLDRAFAEIPPEEWQALRQRWLAVRYDHGLRYRDIAVWVLVVAGLALLFIVQLRRMVKARTSELAREVERRREGEARFRLLIDRAPEAIVLLDPVTGCFIEANPCAERVYGVPRSRIIGSRPAEFSPPSQPDGERSEAKAQSQVAAALAGKDPVFPFLHVHPDGTWVPCEVRLTTLPWEGRTIIRCSVLDLTERQRHEAQLRRNETLANLGQLAGSVAHDFNNMLSGILGYADLIGIHAGDDRARDYAQKIAAAVASAQAQTARLLSFARKGSSTPVVFDVHLVVGSALDLFAASNPRAITVERRFAAEASSILGFPAMFQHAILNLCINARDAMPSGGNLLLCSQVEVVDAPAAAGLLPYAIQPGSYWHLEVVDTGTGMTAEVQARCLEPLFTTKGERGTGLGLSSVHACMIEHNGAMRIRSVIGQGTAIHLWLPLAGRADGGKVADSPQ